MKARQSYIWLARGVTLVALLLFWEAISRHSDYTRFFVGSPVGVAKVIWLWFAGGEIYHHLGITLLETMLAFIIGTVAALVAGLWFALSPFMGAVADPFIKAVNTMPRLLLAPIFAVWFGLGIWSKVALGVTIVFFVVFFNVFQGVRDVNPVLLAHVRMLGATPTQLVRRVYIPSALTWVFSSLHMSVGMAFVGAVIGEYLGSAAGVGYLILQAEGTFDIDTVIAGIVILTAFALVLDALVTKAERSLLSWREDNV